MPPKPRHALLWIVPGMLARGLAHGSALLLTLVAARLLSPAELGVFVVANALAAFGMLFIYAGVYEYLLRADDAALHADAGFSVLLVTAAGVTAAHWALAPLAARGFGSPELAGTMQALSVLPLLGCLSAWREALYLRDPAKVERHHLVVVLRDLGSLALGMAGLLAGWGLAALVLWRLSAAAIGWLAWWRLNPAAPRLDLARPRWREVLAYGGGITGTRLAKFCEINGVDILLGLVLHPAAVGIYRMASRLVVAVLDLIAQPLARLNWVQASDAARAGHAPDGGDGPWHGLMLLLAWPALAVLALESEVLTRHLLGPRWSETGPVLAGLAMVAMLRTTTFALEPAFALCGESARLMHLRALSALLAMAMLALAPLGGMTAVLWGQAAAASVSALLVLRAAQRHVALDLERWARGFARPALVVAVITGSALVMDSLATPPVWHWWMLSLVALAATLAGLWSIRDRLAALAPGATRLEAH